MPFALLHYVLKGEVKLINLLKGLDFYLWIEEGLLQGSCWPLSRRQNKWRHPAARDSMGTDRKGLEDCVERN